MIAVLSAEMRHWGQSTVDRILDYGLLGLSLQAKNLGRSIRTKSIPLEGSVEEQQINFRFSGI